MGSQHQQPCFSLCLGRQGNVDRHLVSVKVSIIGRADKGMDLNGTAFNEDRLKGLNAQAVQCGCTVEKNRVFADDILKNVPYFRLYPFNHALGIFNVMGNPFVYQAPHYKGLKQFQGHFLGQPALIHFELGADDND